MYGQRGMMTADQYQAQHPTWWEDIDAGSQNDQSSSMYIPSKRKRGKVHKNRKKHHKSHHSYALPGNMIQVDNQEDLAALVSLEAKSPLIWSIGTLIVFIIIFACEILQNGGFETFKANPLFGPSDETMIMLGAKYGPPIVAAEWWRYITAIFLHSGVIHLVFVGIFAFLTLDIERNSGFWRAIFVFFTAGSFGFILSTLFVPEMVSTGATGSLFGYVGMLLCDLISTWRGAQRRVCKLVQYIVMIVIALAIGLTPYIDNFAHIGGFIIGFLSAIMLLPNMTFRISETVCYGIISFITFPIMSVLFCVCMVIVFRRIDPKVSWCKWCYVLDCVDINGWCPSLAESTQNTYYIE